MLSREQVSALFQSFVRRAKLFAVIWIARLLAVAVTVFYFTVPFPWLMNHGSSSAFDLGIALAIFISIAVALVFWATHERLKM